MTGEGSSPCHHENMSASTFGKLNPRSSWPFLFLALAVGGCAEADLGSESTTSLPTSTSETGQERSTTTRPTAATTSSIQDSDDPFADKKELLNSIERTVARRTASYELKITQTLPVSGENGATTSRTGSFDDSTLTGRGTLRFAAESDEIARLLGEGEFEFRLVDDTYWLFNPIAEPSGWVGFDVFEYASAVGGDPTLSMDGDLFILVVGDALIEVVERELLSDGSVSWTVRIRADDLLPLVTTGGVQQRLSAAGFEGSTQIDSIAVVTVDPEDMVIAVDMDLDEWWDQVMATVLPEGPIDATMRVEFTLGMFDQSVEVLDPCPDPVEFSNPGAPDGLTCDP